MKKLGIIAAIFTFVAAAIGLIVALVYFLDRRMGGGEEEADDLAYMGEEYYAGDLSFDHPIEEAAEEPAPAEPAPAEAAPEQE